MLRRRSLRLMAGALVLAVPLLGSCGFDKATDRVYTPGAGTNDRDGDMDVLSAVIVSAQPGSGTFLASLSNNLTDEPQTLTSVAGAGSADLTFDPADLSVEVPAQGLVNLLDEDPITVTGDFTPGQVESLTLTFEGGETVTMDVPVVYACNYYEGLDQSVTSASAEPSESESPSAGEVPTESASPSESAGESPSDGSSQGAGSGASGEPYSCPGAGEG